MMNNEELKKKICEIIAPYVSAWGDDERIADALIAAGLRFGENLTATFDHMALEREHELERRLAEAEHRAEGIGDVKEIKYRVRRAEKALYIACRETAEIIFKDDFDRHAQEYMYGYLKQAEKELAEERKDD